GRAARGLGAEPNRGGTRRAREGGAATGRAAEKPLTDPRQRAVCFLRDEPAPGPKPVSAVEEQAAKAHIDEQLLGQARRDLRVVTSRGNTGGVQAVQWSLPG